MSSDDQSEIEIGAAFLAALVSDGVEIDGHILQIGVSTWAIHGHIDYDGESIVAEFASYESARIVLDRLPAHQAAIAPLRELGWTATQLDTGQ
jgi:hypothetical protein